MFINILKIWNGETESPRKGNYFPTIVCAKKEYDEEYTFPWLRIINTILEFTAYYFKEKSYKRIIVNPLAKFTTILSKIWRKKNHLVDSSDKYTYKILSPVIKEGLDGMYKQDLIYYICLLERYGKKELDTWGFEKRPRKKVGKLKRIWYNLTLTAY